MIEKIDCLTTDECIEVSKTVHALRDHWNARLGEGFPFFTLGAASYIDAANVGGLYYKLTAQKLNPLLQKNFSSLYKKVAAVIENQTGLSVAYEENAALPGFHIFQYCKLFKDPIASVHFDLQFNKVRWPYKKVDKEHPISFTLAIALPKNGAGLNYWDIFHNEVKKLKREELDALREKSEKHYLPYETGKIVIHEGLMLHQIAPIEEMEQNDERITLQGHGLICDGVLHLFW